MADDKLEIVIRAKTDEFVKSLDDIKKRTSDLSKQMQEIDKQLKSESVDRVAKLSEKLELVKRSAALAAKEAETYAQSIKEITDKQKEGEELSEKQKKKIEDLSEKMALAKQKANTFAVEIDKLSKELEEGADKADQAEDEIEDVGDAMEESGKQAEKAKSGVSSFLTIFSANLASSLVVKGLEKGISLCKDLASAAIEAAKKVAAAVKEYAVEAVDMAADYEDALGYSEQVFSNYAENVQKWVTDNSVALRINKSELQQYVNGMGSLYRSFGIGAEKAAELSEAMVTLATDLRSATGDDTAQIIKSLTSVMTGGYQAGYKYGIVINEAAIKAKALAMGLVEVSVNEQKVEEARLRLEKATRKASEATLKYGENSLEAQEAQLAVQKASEAFEEALGGQNLALTQANKELAIYALAMEQTEHIQGQGARESGNYKSQLDALRTTFENLQISIGEKLLPVVTDLIKKANDFIQSDEGQKMLDGIVEKVGELADKVKEFVESGQLDEWIEKFKKNAPEVLQDLKDFAGLVGDCVQPLLDVYRAINNFRDLQGLDAAIKSSKQEVHAFAEAAGVDMETLRTSIYGFADLNGKSLTEVYENWAYYQPQVLDYMVATGTVAEEMKTNVSNATSTMAANVESDLDQTGTAFQSGIDKAANADTSGLRAKTEEIESLGQRVLHALGNFVDNSGWFQNAPGAEYAHRASGGPVKAGQLYQVNDDHGRRIELFRSNMDGYILDGDETQRVINKANSIGDAIAAAIKRFQSENIVLPSAPANLAGTAKTGSGDETQRVINNNTYGSVTVYVESRGADAASIADEIGQAISQKRRKAGTW